jgi:glucokinase
MYIGLDIGGSKILGAAVADDLRILGTLKVSTVREEGPAAVLQRALGVCRELKERHGPPRGVGAGFAGLVDRRQGRVLSSIILPGWDGIPLAAELSQGLDLPSVVDNDATAAGYGEWLARGSLPGLNMVLLTVGTGIGGAIIIDGKLYRGATGLSAEFGNTTIQWQGRRCWCGNQGCLNTLASGSAIARRAGELGVEGCPSPAGVERVAEAARDGDSAAAAAIEEGARAMGAGIANIINIFNPDLVVLTGGVVGMGEPYLQTVREEAGRRAFSESADHARIESSALGPHVGAVGAAGMIRDHMNNG